MCIKRFSGCHILIASLPRRLNVFALRVYFYQVVLWSTSSFLVLFLFVIYIPHGICLPITIYIKLVGTQSSTIQLTCYVTSEEVPLIVFLPVAFFLFSLNCLQNITHTEVKTVVFSLKSITVVKITDDLEFSDLFYQL